MFGKIVYMNNNVAHIKLTSGMDAASNLMNMHVVFIPNLRGHRLR